MSGQLTNIGLAGQNQFSFATPSAAALTQNAYITYPTLQPANVQALAYPAAPIAFPQQVPGGPPLGYWAPGPVATMTTYYAPAPINNLTNQSSTQSQQSTAPILQQPASVLTTLIGPESVSSSQVKGHRRPFNASQLNRQKPIFCDVCKISCAGPLTYKEHTEGQRHKKKVAQMEKGEEGGLARNKITYKCEVCGVVCPGNDTYQAHIRGSKHQRALKVHLSMGKPLESTDPTIITPKGVLKSGASKGDSVVKSEGEEVTGDDLKQNISEVIAMYEKDIEAVGADYVEVHGMGKAISYHCKLCDCRFNDPNAKDAHLKGRRHRLQYKKKVDPSIEVDVKFNPRDKRSLRIEPEIISYNPTPLPLCGRITSFIPNSPSLDDKYVYVAHEALKLSDQELAAIEKTVVNVEMALKLVSDNFTQKNPEFDGTFETPDASAMSEDDRVLKGVMRVGDLAKQLLIRGHLGVELVILCACKPTLDILREIGELLPIHLADVTDEKYDIKLMPENASVVIVRESEPKVEVTINLTSVVMRDSQPEDLDINKQQDSVVEPPNILDKKMCLEALAKLRRAKWFQAQCLPYPAMLVALRVLKDFHRRIQPFYCMSQWPLELLVERICSAAGYGLTPTQVIRHVFETISCGLFFEDCNGLLDPCEKERVNAIYGLSSQQIEDVTFVAQQNLRLIAFGKLCDVLNVQEEIVNQGKKRPFPSSANSSASSESKKPRI